MKKNLFFCVGEYAECGFDQQRLIWYVFRLWDKVFRLFDCTTSNTIYCTTYTLCNKLYIGESGRKLGDRFREHLLDVKNERSDLSKPVARHFNIPGHSHKHMEICGINLHFGNNETRKRKEQRLIFKLGTLAPDGVNERFSFA